MTVKLDQRRAAAGDLAAAILDSAHALVVTLDIEGRITSFNRACELLTGYEADDVIGTYIWDRLLPEEVIEPIRQLFASLPDGGEIPEEHETAWTTRDGRRPVIAWNNSVVRNAAGEVDIIVGIGVDVTARRETADRLARTASDLATAQRIAGIGSWRQTIATREEEWSDQYYRNLGLKPGSCLPSIEKFYEHVHPDDRQTVFETMRRSIKEKQPYSLDFRVVWPDGSVRAIHEEDDIVFGDDGEVLALIGTMQDVTESRENASELSSTADRLSRAQRIAGIGNWEWTIETNEKYWSDQFFRNLGLEPGSVEPSVDKFYEFVHPNDREGVRAKILNALETKQPYSADFRIIWPNGTEHLLHEEAEVTLDGAGNAVALTGTMQDVTELRETENRLQQLATRLEYAQQTARIGNWEWDIATDRQWWSDESYRLIGYQPGEVEANDENFFAVIHPDDVAMVKEKSSTAEKTGESCEIVYRVNLRDGTERIIREIGHPAYDDDGKYVGQNGTIQDITEQHATQRDLAETAERLGATVRLARMGNWEWDPESNRLKMSDETLRICGLEPEHGEVDNEFLMAMIPAEEHTCILDLMARSVSEGGAYTNEYHIIRPDGDERSVIEHGAAFHDEGTGKIKLIGTIQDITERKRVEEELARTAKRLDDAQTAARIGNWEWDAETDRDWWSEQQFRNYGIDTPPGFVPGDNYLQFAHPDDREAARQTVDRSVETGAPLDMEFRTIGADGVERVLWIYGATETDADGRVIRTVGTTQDVTVRKHAELDLALSLKRLDILQEAALIGSWEWDIDTGKIWWSDQQYRNYGAAPDGAELSVDSFFQYLHPADRDTVEAGIDKVMTDGAIFDQEYRVVGKDGVQRVLWCHGIAERDKNGKPAKMVGTTLDITVRKDAEWRLAIMTEDLKNAQRIANIGSWEWDIRTNEEHWSDQNYRIYGLEPGAIQPDGDSFLDYVHPEDRAMLLAAQDAAIAGGHPLEVDYRSAGADGVERLIHVSAEVERDSTGKPVRLAGTVQDITERKRVERALRENEARLRGIFDYAPVGIGLADPEGNLIEVNQQFADFLGYSTEETLGLSYKDYTHPDHLEVSKQQLEAQLAGDVARVSQEKLYIRRDGAAVWVNRTLSLIRDEAGAPRFIVVIVEDIDDRKQTEKELALAMEQLEEAQRIAHIGHWNWVPDSTNTVWSDEMFRIFGLEPGATQPTRDSFFEMVHEGDRKSVMTMMTETLNTGQPYTTEFRIIRPDGAKRHVFERGERYIDEQTGEWSVRGITQDITEWKAVEEKLRETAENLKKSERIAKLGSWVWEIEEDTEWWSNEIYRFLGMEISSAAASGFDYLEYVHPDDRERIRATLDKSLREHMPYAAEYRIRHADGHDIFVSEYAETEYDTAGKPVRMRGTSQDITERKQVEQALQESETRLDAFFNEAPVGLAILDSEYRYVKVNETLAQVNGAPTETHVGKYPSEFMSPERAELIENLLRRTLEHGESIDGEESIAPDADGGNRYRVYTQFPLSGDPRKPDTVGVVVVDITDIKQAELVLKQTMERLEEAQRIGQMGIWTRDPEEDTEWWSDQHYRILGLEPGSITLRGFDFLKYVHPDDYDRVEKIEREAVENCTPFSVEYRVIRPDGTERIVSEYGEWSLDGLSGKPICRGVAHDITERKRIELELARLNAELEQRVEERTAELREAQGELIKSERLATLGQLTATVSHELRNPLGAMRTSMYVVEKKTDADDPRLKASIDRVNRNITRCDQIIDELLDYTRIRDLDLRRADIDHWLGAVLDEQNTPAEITVKRKFGAKGARVPFDDDRLRRAVINIFENACHAATDPHNANGVARRPLISVQTSLRKSRVQIEISDNGGGIPPEIREKIFEPLFSTKNFGVGLGLPTVRQIMQQHGGGIEIGENRGGGAKFALWLPLPGELEIADK